MTLFANAKYLTVTEALQYFQYRLNNDSWISATAENREKALIQASRIIDTLPFAGSKTDSDQDLEFPRNGDTSVPEPILIACCEIAFELLDSVDYNLEQGTLFIQSTGALNARVGYNSRYPEHLVFGIPSYSAWQKLKPYVIDPRNVTLVRNS